MGWVKIMFFKSSTFKPFSLTYCPLTSDVCCLHYFFCINSLNPQFLPRLLSLTKCGRNTIYMYLYASYFLSMVLKGQQPLLNKVFIFWKPIDNYITFSTSHLLYLFICLYIYVFVFCEIIIISRTVYLSSLCSLIF